MININESLYPVISSTLFFGFTNKTNFHHIKPAFNYCIQEFIVSLEH